MRARALWCARVAPSGRLTPSHWRNGWHLLFPLPPSGVCELRSAPLRPRGDSRSWSAHGARMLISALRGTLRAFLPLLEKEKAHSANALSTQGPPPPPFSLFSLSLSSSSRVFSSLPHARSLNDCCSLDRSTPPSIIQLYPTIDIRRIIELYYVLQKCAKGFCAAQMVFFGVFSNVGGQI